MCTYYVKKLNGLFFISTFTVTFCIPSCVSLRGGLKACIFLPGGARVEDFEVKLLMYTLFTLYRGVKKMGLKRHYPRIRDYKNCVDRKSSIMYSCTETRKCLLVVKGLRCGLSN